MEGSEFDLDSQGLVYTYYERQESDEDLVKSEDGEMAKIDLTK